MECCSVNRCLKLDNFQSTLMSGSLASLISTDATLLDKEDEATTTKSNKSYTEETHAIDLTTDVTVDTKSAKQVWVQFRRNTLKIEDKHLVENGSRLTDKHINFASCLIARQFPKIGGLRTTLLQTRYYCFPPESIQAIFCKHRKHWIVASNLLTNDCNTVNVYDSLFAELDQESMDIVLRIFQDHHNTKDKKAVTIVMKNLQKQEGSTDCGLFAIAVMASLAHREDPSVIKYDQNKMREHLLECFSSKLIMPFPKVPQ